MNMYNINSVSKISGLSAFVIRMWEKRYNVVTPKRTEGNRRLYSEEDLEKLKLLKQVVDRGNNIGSIAHLDIPSLKDMVASFGPVQDNHLPSSSDAGLYLQQSIQSVRAFDYKQLEKVLVKASIELNHPILIEHVILPLLRFLGEGWQQGSIRIVQEHLASAVIRTFLYNLKDSYKPSPYGLKILFTTPMGQQHEFGALIASLIASSEGWDSIYLGPDLPISEMIAAASVLKPKILAISITFSAEDPQLNKELDKLKFLPADIKVIAGGAGIKLYQKTIEQNNGIVLEDLNQLRDFLRNN